MNKINELVKKIMEGKLSYCDKDLISESINELDCSYDDRYMNEVDSEQYDSYRDDMFNEMYFYQDGLKEVW